MQAFDNERRGFLKNSAWTLITAAAGGSLTHGAMNAHAGQSAVTQTQKTQAAMTPQQALQMLKDGNRRFVEGTPLQRDLMQQVKATAAGQFPFAVLVSCIDSRESSHLIFDQGIGDIFNARVAGNFVNDDILGSLEFACAVTGARLVVVMGHTECGAVKGACDDVVLGNLTQTLANIKPAVAAVSGYEADRSSKNKKFVQAVAEKKRGADRRAHPRAQCNSAGHGPKRANRSDGRHVQRSRRTCDVHVDRGLQAARVNHCQTCTRL